jgi:hypothetical protein
MKEAAFLCHLCNVLSRQSEKKLGGVPFAISFGRERIPDGYYERPG